MSSISFPPCQNVPSRLRHGKSVNIYNKEEAGDTNRCPTIYKGSARQPKLLCMCVCRSATFPPLLYGVCQDRLKRI